MRIYLNGFMGSGKSTIGKALANKLCCLYVDLDEFIEEKTFTKIPIIFSQWGESYFRELELEYLNDLLIYDNIVIACGGGTVTKSESLNFMNENGTTVFVENSFDTLFQRLNKSEEIEKRPLLKSMNASNLKAEMQMLFYLRQPYYDKCAIKIDGSAQVESIIENIKLKSQLSFI
ncbi:MAG: shikimate kinase [Bacteroidota bacterium]|jgi:shikimate kinase